jgi:hypothetical protein
MLLAATILKGMVELLLMVMLGQGLLFVLAGASRERNAVYRMFATVTQPVMKVTRAITPRFIVDQHIGFVAFFLLVATWFAALALKVHFYTQAVRGG